MSEKLKSCPFCGATADIIYCEGECCGAKPRWVRCNLCSCEITAENKHNYWLNDKEAIKAWNRRSK